MGRAVLNEAATLFQRAGVPVMPLKGVWLHQFVYTNPSERRISDVDLLVPEARYDDAGHVLRAAGWRCTIWNTYEATFRSPRYPLSVDLHCALFPSGAFNMPTAELFRRGRHDSETFGVELVSPDPRDVFAHLVGHFVKSPAGKTLEPRLGPELTQLAAAFQLEPGSLAKHLEACGMARAARYALWIAANGDRDHFCQTVARELSPNPLDDLSARVLMRSRAVLARSWQLNVLRGCALEPSWFRFARTCAYTIRDGRRRRRTAASYEH
jgi:hypothetical protein